MSNLLDPIDEKIISILKINSRQPFVEIAKEIGLSESAIRRRVKNLMDTKIEPAPLHLFQWHRHQTPRQYLLP
jgi:DNA-binding Lrp family transcriptional regulator